MLVKQKTRIFSKKITRILLMTTIQQMDHVLKMTMLLLKAHGKIIMMELITLKDMVSQVMVLISVPSFLITKSL